jgi:uncharacterized membrane protein YgcG
MRLPTARPILAALLLLASRGALATEYIEVCHACDPGDALDNQVYNILDRYRQTIRAGDTVIIRDDRLEDGATFYFVKWEYRNGSFVATENGYMYVASSGGGGSNGGGGGGGYGGGGGGISPILVPATVCGAGVCRTEWIVVGYHPY